MLAIALALLALAPPDGVPAAGVDRVALLVALGSPDEAERAEAIATAEELLERDPDDPVLAEVVVFLLHRPEAASRARGSKILLRLAEAASRQLAAAVDRVVDELPRARPINRADMLAALGAVGPPALPAAPVLRDVMNGGGHVFQKVQAAWALCRIEPDDRSAMTQLADWLADPEPRARWAAASALGRLGEDATGAQDRIRPLLADPHPVVRVVAAGALWRINGQTDEVVPVLLAALSEEDQIAPARPIMVSDATVPTHRMVALGYLGQMGESAGEPAVQPVAALVAEEDPLIRFAALSALGRMGKLARDSAAVVRGALADEVPDVRAAAVNALARMRLTPEE